MPASEVAVTLTVGGMAPLDALMARLTDLSPAMERASAVMSASVRENFAAQGRPEPWAPLSLNTIHHKGHSRILYDTGRLSGSFLANSDADSATVSTPVFYARPLQEGVPGVSADRFATPARPFFLFQPDDIMRITDLVGSYINGG